MGLFGKSQKEKQRMAQAQIEQVMNNLIARYNIPANDSDLDALYEIAVEYNSLGLQRGASLLSNINPSEQVKISFLSTITKQNWLMIKKLGEISSSLVNIQTNINNIDIEELSSDVSKIENTVNCMYDSDIFEKTVKSK